jgi:peptide-methionine (S)-S-oxide reductase
MGEHGIEQSVTLGMGCFWGPEALFGHLPGVVRTRVGYAGGTTKFPSYTYIANHSETVELDFNPSLITLEQLLNVFWDNHKPSNINGYKGRQYNSILLYRNEEQQAVITEIHRKKGEPDTEIVPYSRFHLAEERHQKYYLKRFPDAILKLSELYSSPEDLQVSTLAARLNVLAKGYTNLERIRNEIAEWLIPAPEQEKLVQLIRSI